MNCVVAYKGQRDKRLSKTEMFQQLNEKWLLIAFISRVFIEEILYEKITLNNSEIHPRNVTVNGGIDAGRNRLATC